MRGSCVNLVTYFTALVARHPRRNTLPESAPGAFGQRMMRTPLHSARQETRMNLNDKPRLTAADFPPEVMTLFDQYVHGLIDRRAFLDRAARYAVVGTSAAAMLAALDCVDFVTVFEEDTPKEAILKCRPDVLVKGGDYTLDTVVGAAEVQGWGGQVELIPLVAGQSSTRLIESM